jgi:hypothetical protein
MGGTVAQIAAGLPHLERFQNTGFVAERRDAEE